jgi:hypothetical protein
MNRTTRRALLGAGAAGAALAPLLVAPEVFAASTTRGNLYRRARFRALRHRRFRLEGADRDFRARLTRVRNLPNAARGDELAFSVTFRTGRPGPEQGSYVLRRPGFRATTLFLVPSDDARRTYEAVVFRTPRRRLRR